MPSPNLRANIVNNLLRPFSTTQRFGQTQIEARIIDQHDSGRIDLIDLIERLVKFLAEVTIFFQYLPKAEDAGIGDPIFERLVCQRFHLRTASAGKLQARLKILQGAHDRGAVIIATRLTDNEVEGVRHSGATVPVAILLIRKRDACATLRLTTVRNLFGDLHRQLERGSRLKSRDPRFPAGGGTFDKRGEFTFEWFLSFNFDFVARYPP